MIEMNDDGGSAFPATKDPAFFGMTMRDYFAAKVLQGILAGSGDRDGFVEYDAEALAEQCYQTADFMLKARDFK